MPKKFDLRAKDAVLLIVDVQERLATVMGRRDDVVANCVRLAEGAKVLGVPVVVTEQYPKGLGHTVGEIRAALPGQEPVVKLAFDCTKEDSFREKFPLKGRGQVILAGMETHICVLQTCLGLLGAGLDVHVVRDAVCSRADDNFSTGVEFMRDAGAVITSTETVLFQLLVRAGAEEFKAVQRLVK